MRQKTARGKYHPAAGSLLNQSQGLLRRFNLQPRKRLGQHFLIDEAVLKTIIEAAELTPTDVIIEIGPGLGILTRQLSQQAGQVIAIELDSQLAAILKRTLAPFSNVVIVNKDVLKTEPATLLKEQAAANSGYKVVANLPYYITSPVLRHFLEAQVKPQIMVVMVQEEVAETIVAAPGQMRLLSVSVQFYGKPRIISQVPAGCFYPMPEVDSALLRIDLYPQPALAVADRDGFFNLVRAGFSASRKQIANSLAQGLGLEKADVLSLLEQADIAQQRRAQTLTLDEWGRLWQVFSRGRDG
ncbi:MAG: 16S rRNA (adenine(1518)-N(6)/adenine(1519)-N(6))-dimethyltransferase RsmA [Dehalococcoidia bacterium]|nr:MAG: 16S rRNA (adenine(1518)-N(6)/adenine(1519)-N(6))-dimethyltransferase RsmA [Dehalococcoidia bacterium]